MRWYNLEGKKTKIFGLLMAFIIFGIIFCSYAQKTTDIKLRQVGSSTVLPLAIAWAEEFEGAQIFVSGGGSSHGLNALLMKEADLINTSRLLKDSDYKLAGCDGSLVNIDGSAMAVCRDVLPTKWIVAYDILVVVINNENNWAEELTYDQLYKIFTSDMPAVYWDEVPDLKERGAPHAKITLYAPDEASGTYDYFFETIIKDWGKRTQVTKTRLNLGDGAYNPTADDNVILDAIKTNKYAIGFFGFSYVVENPNQLKIVKIAKISGEEYVEASVENVAKYPIVRPLYIYTNGIPDDSTDKGKAINTYLKYILSEDGQEIVPEVGFVKISLVDPTVLPAQLSKLN